MRQPSAARAWLRRGEAAYQTGDLADAEAAADGERALRRLDEERFDVVLLDVMMPGLSGLDVLRGVRVRWPESDLPVIMVTARDATEDVVEALQAGANDYVTKPLDFPVVLARVETQLTLKRQKEEHGRLRREADRERQQAECQHGGEEHRRRVT